MVAVMFKVEAAVRIGLTSAACTSEACRYLVNSHIILFHLLIANDVRNPDDIYLSYLLTS